MEYTLKRTSKITATADQTYVTSAGAPCQSVCAAAIHGCLGLAFGAPYLALIWYSLVDDVLRAAGQTVLC
eukprot:scaffold204770_cov26-Prasinocladus_malaysianus.AAC.1